MHTLKQTRQDLEARLTAMQEQLAHTKDQLAHARDDSARTRLLDLKEVFEEDIDELQQQLKNIEP